MSMTNSTNRVENEIAISTNNDGAIKYVIDGVSNKRQGQVNVCFFFLMTLPRCAATVAPGSFFRKSRHMAFNPKMLDGSDVLTMTRVCTRKPC